MYWNFYNFFKSQYFYGHLLVAPHGRMEYSKWGEAPNLTPMARYRYREDNR